MSLPCSCLPECWCARVPGGCVRYIDGVASGKDPLRLGIHVTVYVALYVATLFVFAGILVWLLGYPTAAMGATLLSAVFANWLALRIYEDRHLVAIGLWLNRRSEIGRRACRE